MTDTETIHYCEVHTDKETELRCNKCDRYMCVACAVQTPVGYKCKECTRSHEDRFFTATQNDLVMVVAASGGLSILAGLIMGAIGIIFLAIIIGFPAGGAIAEATMRAVQNRRSRNMAQIGVTALVIGTIIGIAIQGYFSYPDEFNQIAQEFRRQNIDVPSDLLLSTHILNKVLSFGTILYTGLASMALYTRMK